MKINPKTTVSTTALGTFDDLEDFGFAISAVIVNRYHGEKRATRFIESAEMTLAHTREGIFIAVQNLAESSENLRDFSRIIREDPSLLLGGSRREERRLP